MYMHIYTHVYMHLFPVQLQFYSVLLKQDLLANNKRGKEHQKQDSAQYLTVSPLPPYGLFQYRKKDF